MFNNDYESRREIRKQIFGDPEKGEVPDYSFPKVLKYIFTMILLAVIVSILTKVFY